MPVEASSVKVAGFDAASFISYWSFVINAHIGPNILLHLVFLELLLDAPVVSQSLVVRPELSGGFRSVLLVLLLPRLHHLVLHLLSPFLQFSGFIIGIGLFRTWFPPRFISVPRLLLP